MLSQGNQYSDRYKIYCLSGGRYKICCLTGGASIVTQWSAVEQLVEC